MILQKEINEYQQSQDEQIFCYQCKERFEINDKCYAITRYVIKKDFGNFGTAYASNELTKGGHLLEIIFCKKCFLSNAGNEWLFEEHE